MNTPLPAVRSARHTVLARRRAQLTGYWWVLLVAGIAWLAAALVILQFDNASVTTVGVLVGLMFLGVGVENIALARLNVPMRWAWALFGGLFLVSAVVCFANPTDTFAGLADMLGFLFLIAGVWSMVRAFLKRAINPLWWMGLISGILLTGACLLDLGPVLHPQGVRAPGLRRDLGADAGHHEHRARTSDPHAARGALRDAMRGSGAAAVRPPPPRRAGRKLVDDPHDRGTALHGDERHRSPRGRGLDIDPHDAAGRRRCRRRLGGGVDRGGAPRDLRRDLQRRRAFAGCGCDGAAPPLEPSAVLHGARAGDRRSSSPRSLLVLAQAIGGAVRDFSDDLPEIVDKARHSDLGSFVNGGSDSLDTLSEHANDITQGCRQRRRPASPMSGFSAFGAVTLGFSVVFLTLFGLIEEPRLRDWIGGLLYRGRRERYMRVTDRIVNTTSRYMLGNLAISVICGTVYGVTAVILGLPYPLAVAVIAGILDLIPNLGATIAGIIIGLVALSVSLEALIVFAIVIVVYQQIENYILQPTIIGKAAGVAGFTVWPASWRSGRCSGGRGDLGVPIAAGLQIVAEEITAGRRARIAAADAAEQQPA